MAARHQAEPPLLDVLSRDVLDLPSSENGDEVKLDSRAVAPQRRRLAFAVVLGVAQVLLRRFLEGHACLAQPGDDTHLDVS
jgi:hypothetical protein